MDCNDAPILSLDGVDDRDDSEVGADAVGVLAESSTGDQSIALTAPSTAST